MRVSGGFTQNTLRDAKNQFNSLVNTISGTNGKHEITQSLENLESILRELRDRGVFERPDDTRKKIYGSNDGLEEEYREQDALEAAAARQMIAQAGLRILQKTIPFLAEIGDRCLEVAGKDAVRLVCSPTQREGTDSYGEPYKPMASEFTLPPGYAPSLIDKAKSAIKR